MKLCNKVFHENLYILIPFQTSSFQTYNLINVTNGIFFFKTAHLSNQKSWVIRSNWNCFLRSVYPHLSSQVNNYLSGAARGARGPGTKWPQHRSRNPCLTSVKSPLQILYFQIDFTRNLFIRFRESFKIVASRRGFKNNYPITPNGISLPNGTACKQSHRLIYPVTMYFEAVFYKEFQ